MSYVAHTEQERERMLAEIGVKALADLFCDIPEEVRFKDSMGIGKAMPEQTVSAHLKGLAGKNKNLDEYTSYLGAGAYEHYVPAFIDQLLMRSEFYTAYTPYQPEISQGTLQAIYEFQSLICELTGMDGANASMYEGATAVAEAALMACEATRKKKIAVPKTVHPEYRMVLKTYLNPRGIEIIETGYQDGESDFAELREKLNGAIAGVILQIPNFFGIVEEGEQISQAVHDQGGLMIGIVNPISLGILKPPGSWGADIVVGEGQPLGNSLNFGGPYLGFMACKEKYVRRMPGRIAGMTKDRDGKRGFVLTLQAREQHIRREKSTSNICSNQALCALAFTMHLSALGKQGLKELANLNIQKAHYAAGQIAALPGMKMAFAAPFFHEFIIETTADPEQINAKLLQDKIIGGLNLKRFYPDLDHHLLFCVTETKSKEEIDTLVNRLGEMG